MGRAFEFLVATMGLTLSYPPISSDPTRGVGLGMGWEHLKELGKEKKVVPEFECEPIRDPQLGFEGQRKLRGEKETLLRRRNRSI